MIRILHSNTHPDTEWWEGHPCIPNRVFGPKEYLIDPSEQLTKLRVTLRPIPAMSSRSVLVSQQPQSWLGSFKATRTQCGECGSRPKEQGDGASAQFVAWFDTAFATSSPQLKQQAILASWDAASAVLAEAHQEREESMEGPGSCWLQVTHGHLNTRIEYRVEMADMRYVKEWGSSDQPVSNEASSQQIKLDKLQPGRDFKPLTGSCTYYSHRLYLLLT